MTRTTPNKDWPQGTSRWHQDTPFRAIGTAVVFAATLLGAGCAAPGQRPQAPTAPANEATPPPQSAPSNTSVTVTEPTPTTPDKKVTPYDLTQRVLSTLPLRSRSNPATQLDPVPPGPDALVGLSGITIANAFGSPSFRRKEPPAEIWQYRDPSCILDLFLYPSKSDSLATGASPVMRVSHAYLRGRSITAVEKQACFSRILNGRSKK